jgi:hypothetical protein
MPTSPFEMFGEVNMHTDDWIFGRTVRPTNARYQDAGSIHDDSTARELGFRGGTIAGSAHLDPFVPLGTSQFGSRWFESGSVSMYFRHATLDGEETTAKIVRPTSTSSWMGNAVVETPEGVVVGEGTIGFGEPQVHTALGGRDLRHSNEGLQLLSNLRQGDGFSSEGTIDARQVQDRCQSGEITEPLDWYANKSPWGGAISPPSSIINLVSDAAGDALLGRIGSAVGLWGALEVRFLGRPVPLDASLMVRGVVVATGESPRTETLWYDAFVDLDGVPIASARVLTRFVKFA